MEQKFKKAEFDFNDFLEYMGQIRNMGGIGSILNMLPGMGLGGKMKGLDAGATEDAEANLKRTESIIYSIRQRKEAIRIFLILQERIELPEVPVLI